MVCPMVTDRDLCGGRGCTKFVLGSLDDGDPGETDWELMVDVCADQLDRFTPKEQGFIHSLLSWHSTPTAKQLSWLVALFERVQG
jgi:hypothetical protein